MSQVRDGELQRTDQVVTQRALVAAVVQLEEARAEVRHVDLDRALPGARLARQAAGHGVIHLMGEVFLALAARTVVAQACRQALEPRHLVARRRQHVDVGLALQAQPFAHQRSTALGRMLAFTGSLPRRAHGVVGVVVVAGAIAVAVHGAREVLPHAFVDGAVEVAAQGHAIDLGQALGAVWRGADLARVELVVRVESALQALQRRVQLAEVLRHVFRTQALAVLAPQQAAIAFGQRRHGVGNRLDQCGLGRVLHVQCRAHVQHAGIDVAEHAVGQAVAIEQCTEVGDVVGQLLWRYRGVFHERLRAYFALDVAQQAHRTFTHGVDAGHRLGTLGQGVAQALDAGVVLQVLDERLHLGIDLGRLVAAELHQVDAQGRALGVGREVFGDAVPDDVLHRQHQHLGVDGLDRQRLVRHQRVGITQRIHEAGVAHVDQHGVLGDRQHIELGFDHIAQRALGTAQHAVEVETALLVAQVRQVVAGQATVELGEGGFNQFGLGFLNFPGHAVHLTDPARRGAGLLQRGIVDRQAVQALATEQHAVQLQYVVAGLAVGAAALAAGVGVDHAADGGAVGGGQLGGEEQPVRLERGVELVLDGTGLHPHPAFLDVDFEDLVHVPRQVDDDPVGQRLAVGARTTAARGQLDLLEARLGHQRGDPRHIVGVQREHRRLWQALVDRVVGGQHRAGAVVGTDLATEAAVAQGFEEFGVIGARCNGGQLGDHRRMAS
ncbi:hypothetical protein D3C76_643150 [compost metagenome]